MKSGLRLRLGWIVIQAVGVISIDCERRFIPVQTIVEKLLEVGSLAEAEARNKS